MKDQTRSGIQLLCWAAVSGVLLLLGWAVGGEFGQTLAVFAMMGCLVFGLFGLGRISMGLANRSAAPAPKSASDLAPGWHTGDDGVRRYWTGTVWSDVPSDSDPRS
ncbi:hypothetical protein [Nocardioides massiliensis]|uniref:DUF2510 domain-containing protein n=1 Tax=Nocardioides massiliensis TaxID=1325935 RepID=A0ABT9NJ37_9ACTN|nr:hypothetical protein [Nocardioides massiliensis]MDP9820432.1 hypothetical protein [Nocardioides massiliensis]